MPTRLAILLGLTLSAALPQGREKRIVPLTDSQTLPARKSAGVAVLVGVGKYPRFSGFSELRYPARDVELLDKELTAQRYQVLPIVDGDATKESILNAITQAGDALDPGQGTIVFFFSGHGYAQGADNMLATVDASSAKLGQTGLSLRDVEKALMATNAPRRMLWIDACRNDPGKGLNDGRSFTKFQGASGTRILFSTRFGHISYEDDEFRQGVFSHYLVEALRGEAAKDDGWISFRDLSDYVTEQVKSRTLRQGRTQVPFEGTGMGDASGDFAIARLSGGPVRVDPPHVEPVAGEVKVNPKDGQRYVWIPPGRFTMGCSPGDADCFDDEKPAHAVEITKGFWMGQTAVTVGAWKRMGLALPPEPKFLDRALNAGWADLQQPVVNETWAEAKGYCEAAGMRLPTEAESEYAARAGSGGARYGNLDDIAWYADNSGKSKLDGAAIWKNDPSNYGKRLSGKGDGPHAVGMKRPNAWNLYDMLGNVWQWTADWYGEKSYEQKEGRDPAGPPGGTQRTLRGGSWYSDGRVTRVSGRYGLDPVYRDFNIGFRCIGE